MSDGSHIHPSLHCGVLFTVLSMRKAYAVAPRNELHVNVTCVALHTLVRPLGFVGSGDGGEHTPQSCGQLLHVSPASQMLFGHEEVGGGGGGGGVTPLLSNLKANAGRSTWLTTTNTSSFGL